MADVSFQPDSRVAEIAAAYALEAADLAANNFGVTLDGTDESIRQVERMLGELHKEMGAAQPPEGTVWRFAKAFGSYVGEVLRRHHGGEWGMVGRGEQSFPGIRQVGGSLCWPWSRVHKRIVDGPEENVWHYYRVLTEGSDTQNVSPAPPV